MSFIFCHSELVSESISYYANSNYKSLNVLIGTKTQSLFLKMKQKDNCVCVVDESIILNRISQNLK